MKSLLSRLLPLSLLRKRKIIYRFYTSRGFMVPFLLPAATSSLRRTPDIPEVELVASPSHPPISSLTLNVLWIINDEVPIPHHRKVHWEVTDVIPFIEILPEKTQQSKEFINHPYTQKHRKGTRIKPEDSFTLFCLFPRCLNLLLPVTTGQKQDGQVRFKTLNILFLWQSHNFPSFPVSCYIP